MSNAVIRRAGTIRARVVLIVLMGAVLPLTLLGVWLTRSSVRAGEALLRGELQNSLNGVVSGIRQHWEEEYAALELLAGNQPVLDGLRAKLQSDSQLDAGAITFLNTVYADLGSKVAGAVIHDRAGRERWRGGDDRARRSAAREGLVRLPDAGTLPVRIAIRDEGRGDTLGTLDVELQVQAVLPSGITPVVPGGAMLAIYDGGTGLALTTDSIGREPLASGTFRRGKATWLAERVILSEPALELYVASPLDPYVGPHRRAARTGAVSLVAVTAVVLILTIFLSTRLTRSLESLAGAADAVASGQLDRHVEVSAPDEVARVAMAFNTMTASLRATLDTMARRESLAAVGEFAASLAHEIRNGHTAARVDLQRAIRRASEGGGENAAPLVERALERITRLDRTVTASLRLARSGTLDAAPLDVREPLSSAVEQARGEAETRGVIVRAAASDGTTVMVKGDAAALEALFLNLLLNGIDAAAPNGWVSVAIANGATGAEVRVRDSGAGINAKDVSRVFEPLYSTKPGGTGLGLSIARRIAQVHGGDVTLESSGGETCVLVRLPLTT